MPDPVTMAAVGTELLPFVMSLFDKGPERVDPAELLRQLIGEFEAVLGPAGEQMAQAATRQGGITGAGLAQDMASSVGSIGGGSAGQPRAARALGASAASNMASAGGAEARMKVAQAISQLAAQTLPSAINAQGMQKPPTWYQNILSGLAGVTQATGKNPFSALLDRILTDSGPGESPITVEDFQNIMASPLVTGMGTRPMLQQERRQYFPVPFTPGG